MVVRIEGSAAEIDDRLKRAGVHLTAAGGTSHKGPDRARSLAAPSSCSSTSCGASTAPTRAAATSSRSTCPPKGSRVILGPGEDAGVVRLGRGGRGLLRAGGRPREPQSSLADPARRGRGHRHRRHRAGRLLHGGGRGRRDGRAALRRPRRGHGPRASRRSSRAWCRGIWEYGNALGVPNVGGDVFFDKGYDENCLVNVIALGVAREEEIIRSRVPRAAAERALRPPLVGKPTDMSGLGGATMASRILDVGGESGFSTVQIHDPFLKRVLDRGDQERARIPARRRAWRSATRTWAPAASRAR